CLGDDETVSLSDRGGCPSELSPWSSSLCYPHLSSHSHCSESRAGLSRAGVARCDRRVVSRRPPLRDFIPFARRSDCQTHVAIAFRQGRSRTGGADQEAAAPNQGRIGPKSSIPQRQVAGCPAGIQGGSPMKTVTIVAGVLLVFVFVWERVDVVRLGYQIERLKIQKVLLERERDQLQVKFSALAAPERIAKVATEKLGLIPPQQGQVLMVHQPGEAPSLSLPSVEQV